MKTTRDARYHEIIAHLRQIREDRKITQTVLAEKLDSAQSLVAKVESAERRLDIVEFFDWLKALEYEPKQFFEEIGWFPRHIEEAGLVPIPLRGQVEKHPRGVRVPLVWQGQNHYIVLEGTTTHKYLKIEEEIVGLFGQLNQPKPPFKNREAIAQALLLAVDEMPDLNPSDVYQHIIYRLYIREYTQSKADHSWVRAGGEAVEVFIERRYRERLAAAGITIRALLSGRAKAEASAAMDLLSIGASKLDIALYGEHRGRQVIFGGIHSKASLAERVSDDEPCSRRMIEKGLVSILYTFDSKSFPPPHGDLVNKGELGSIEQPSAKRKYVEVDGIFSACFSYNLRSVPSPLTTPSNRRIFVSSLKPEEDTLPDFIIDAWKQFHS